MLKPMDRLAIVAAILIVGMCQAVASTQEPTRGDLIDAYYKLRDQAKSAYKDAYKPGVFAMPRGNVSFNALTDEGKRAQFFFQGVRIKNQTASENTKQIIKVWACPVRNGAETGKVNIESREWLPKERLYIYFETATPVQVNFLQDFPGKESVKVFPSEDFPDSYTPVPAGKAVKFPVRIELDDGTEDELMTIVVSTSGQLPDPGTANAHLTNQEFLVFSRKYAATAKAKIDSARPMVKFRPASGQQQSGDPDDVATIACGPDHNGKIQLKLTKRR
jgi:hypothetical protein